MAFLTITLFLLTKIKINLLEPAPPTEVRISTTHHTITIEWKFPSGFFDYNVVALYRRKDLNKSVVCF